MCDNNIEFDEIVKNVTNRLLCVVIFAEILYIDLTDTESSAANSFEFDEIVQNASSDLQLNNCVFCRYCKYIDLIDVVCCKITIPIKVKLSCRETGRLLNIVILA